MHWGKQMVVVQSVYRLTSFGGYCSVFQLGKCVEVFWVVIVTRGGGAGDLGIPNVLKCAGSPT